MQLRRRRRSLALALLIAGAGVYALVCAWNSDSGGRLIAAVGGLFALVLSGILLREELRPFRFTIGPDGITTREGRQDWAAIDRVVLDEPVPPSVSGPHLVLQPGDRIVLKLQDVRQPQSEIVAALHEHAGARFEDRIARRGPKPPFATVLRGYEPGRVDRLIRRAQDALLWGDAAERAEVRAALEEPDLLVVTRGYDPVEVEPHLRKLHARLAPER